MNVVLFEPEIPGNTGNVARTCVATGTTLHLVGPLGFKLEGKEFRRAGLDYWPKLKLVRHESLAAFEASLPPKAQVLAFSAEAKSDFWKAPYSPDGYLLFGKESTGLPAEARARFPLFRVPHRPDVRSLNLATAAGVVLYEALRATGFKA